MTGSHGSRVVVFLSSLSSGGAERVAVRVCGWLRDAGHDVCLLTLSGVSTDFYACPEGVTRQALDMQGASGNPITALFANVRRLLAIRRVVRSFHADVVLSLGDRSNVLMLLALIGMYCRKVISERADPVLEPLSRGWSLLRKLAYPMASLHVSQSSYVSDWMRQRFPGVPCRVIGNAGDAVTDAGTASCRDPGERERLRLITVGRLSKQKGIDILLDACSQALGRSRVKFELVIVGDGEDRDALAAQAAELRLGNSVRFLGRLHDVHAQLVSSDVFVLPSRSEGFPNSMIEAMSVGLPVIAARCRGGVEDILGDACGRQYALDFPPGDAEALAERIVRIVEDANLRRRLGACSRERAADYRPDRIAALWRDVVETE